MFKPSKGPKEGRSPPGLLYTGAQPSSRGRYSSRQIAIGVILAVCFFMGYLVVNSETGTISSIPTTVPVTKSGAAAIGNALLGDNQRAPPSADSNAHELHAEGSALNGKPKSQGTADQYSDDRSTGQSTKPFGEQVDNAYQKPASGSMGEVKKPKQTSEDGDSMDATPGNPKGWKPHSGSSHSDDTYSFNPDKSDKAPVREKWAERPQFELALAKVIAMLPDEVHMRELIRPVEGSGKEKMREMGLRTRAYRKYFEAWEALHMTSDAEGATYIRDDVIAYIRNHQQARDSTEFSEEGVDGLTLASTIHLYEAYRAFIQKFANLLFPWTAPYFSDHMTLHASMKKGGRGIVLTAGDDQAPYLLTTVYSYRQLGCTLPIEIMYLGDQDLGEDYRAELEALPGVTTRDIAQMTNDEGWKLAGWAAKPFAMLLSSFREVIFIDADSLFFKNPETLFDDPDYKKTGALFFRDRIIMPESKKRWLQQVLPKPVPKLAKESRWWTGESGHMQESGVVVVDKWQHFIAMMLVTRFNGPDRDGNKEKGITGVYDMMYGDKETFWIGFLLAGDEKYSFHQGAAGIMGELKKEEDKAEGEKNRKQKRDEPLDEEHDHSHEHKEKTDETKQPDEENLPTPAAEKLAETEDTTTSSTEEVAEVNDYVNLSSLEPETQNHTICAPQLLHLDLQGKPLWFNGWLLHNKFADKNKKKFANFDHYLKEPKNSKELNAWQLAESNMCCLTVPEANKFDFSTEERATLQMIMDRAHEMGMGEQR